MADRGAPAPRAARLLHRAMLRTGRGPVRPLWAALHELAMRALGRYLCRGMPQSGTYTTGSLGADDAVYGLSDIDLHVVLTQAPDRPQARRREVERRWATLRQWMPRLEELAFDVAVCEDSDLRDALEGTPFTYGLDRPNGSDPSRQAAYFGSNARRGLLLRERPGPRMTLGDWRRVSGGLRLPSRRGPTPQERRSAAWLELQWWWRYAFDLCVDSSGPRAAHLCMKLIAEPVRAWLWLIAGEQIRGRREALRRGLHALPEEEGAIGLALELERTLHLRPEPPVEEAIGALVRLTNRIARRLVRDAAAAGWTAVRLRGSEPALTATARRHAAELGQTDGSPPLPLADWRAVVVPRLPDEVFIALGSDPTDPGAVAAAASAGATGACPVLPAEDVHVMPTTELVGEGLLRAVQCRVTDPVSFALAADEDEAFFPELRGWSARDTASRAVAEHRAWLASPGRPERTFLALGAVPDDVLTTARLLTAVRAAMFRETLDRGAAELAVTMPAAVERLCVEVPNAEPVVAECYRYYRSWQVRGDGGGAPPVAALRAIVLGLPPYAS